MKKWICLLGMMLCFMVGTISAYADIIWEPQNNFIEKHREECKVVSREYTANGPDGVVILYESPESNTEVATWENGYQTWIIYTYEDNQGVVWGYPYGSSAMSGETSAFDGWMPMEYMELVYDSISFMEEHRNQLVEPGGVLDESYEGEIYFWEYPGSKNKISSFESAPEYESIYTDEEGRSWGWTMSNSDYRWICLDNPTAEYEELYPNGAPQVEVKDNEEIQEGENQAIEEGESQSKENQSTERITPKTNPGTIVVVVVLVAAVVLITIVLLVMLKKRKQ